VAAGWLGWLLVGLFNCWVTMGYSLPELESAPAFFLESYPQVYPQAGQGVGITAQPAQQAPPVAELQRGVSCTPQQKIFAKVKAVIWL